MQGCPQSQGFGFDGQLQTVTKDFLHETNCTAAIGTISAIDGSDIVGANTERTVERLIALPPDIVTATPKLVPSIWYCTVPVAALENNVQ